MKLLIINQWLHHKNLEGLRKMIEYTEHSMGQKFYYKMGDVNDLTTTSWDVVYSPAITINTNDYPKTFFIFGPHFSVFPTEKLRFINNRRRNCVYVQPSV